MSRVFNFSAGPAALPEAVLQQAAAEMLEWRGTGCGVMEMSHRGRPFASIVETAERDLRELLAVPDAYRVLFLQGGATQQFAQIPMNLLGGGRADYVVTGAWSRKAWLEARRITPFVGGSVRLIADTSASDFTRLPRADEYPDDASGDEAAYIHLCTNETVHGVEFLDEAHLPPGRAPLVADMSSHILSRPIDISRYGMIYAGAQKNIGPSGLVIVIVREDMLDRAWAGTPDILNYRAMADHASLLNTPATWSIYVAGLVFQWLKEQGGLAAMAERNRAKAAALYDYIDHSGFYRNPVEPSCRSRMNVPFRLADTMLDGAFLAGAEGAGLAQLKGHKSVGGMRASIYNAMPKAGVDALIEYMRDFAREHR